MNHKIHQYLKKTHSALRFKPLGIATPLVKMVNIIPFSYF